ncbi:sec-independent protein translocase protein TatA [Klenkia marina]|uniref:Sec-independent protein translocase protein TatA n=1 Tax=Klenkia marina TaxID=1960309 RepID=A0A1G4XTV5_9ACTN|nr:Sec-independent protein translocase subunit TatA [Klenkia marina]SCX44098.1 sec-independent protein translocase protein TatA [Klenkia marina]
MNLGAPEIALIVLAVFVLFGYKKLPDATRSLGRSLRIFKGEMKGMADDGRPTAAQPVRPGAVGTTEPSSPEALEVAAAEAEAAALEARTRAARARADAQR